MTDPEYRKLLDQQDWAKIYPELVLFACEKAVSGKFWTGTTRHFEMQEDKNHGGGPAPRNNIKTDPMLANGKTPEDVVQEVLAEVVKGKGKWRWDPTRNLDIRVHLRYRIWSRLSKLVKHSDNTKRRRVLKDDKGEERFDLIEKKDAGVQAAGTKELHEDSVLLEEPANPEQGDFDPGRFGAFLERRLGEETDLRSTDEHIRNAFIGDDDLEVIYDYVANETPPRDIAKELGIPVTDVNNLKKRLYRRLEDEFPEEFEDD